MQETYWYMLILVINQLANDTQLYVFITSLGYLKSMRIETNIPLLVGNDEMMPVNHQ